MHIPGGGGTSERVDLASTFRQYRAALEDRPFFFFILTATLCFMATSWFTSAQVLYLRDALAFSPRRIMMLMALGSAAVLLTIRPWQRFADYSGSGRTMYKTLTAHSLGVLAFLALPPDAPWSAYAVWPATVFVAVFGAAFWMAAHRAMLNFVKESHRVAYTNVWIVGAALAMGFSPICAGLAIDWWALWGFRLCFLMSGGLGLLCALVSMWVIRDDPQAEGAHMRLMNPGLPVRTLARILWITAGMHESNRPPRPAP